MSVLSTHNFQTWDGIPVNRVENFEDSWCMKPAELRYSK